jgi:hypothetical protein
MLRMFLTVALLGSLPFGPVGAAAPFDGEWSGGSPGVHVGNRPCPPTTATATVADGKLAGKYVVGNNTFKLGGTVAADGTVTGKWGANPMTGKFAGDHFSGSYQSGECGVERPISLDKVK